MVNLHVVFSPSAAVSLREALALLGSSDQVVASFDDLTLGPINPRDPLAKQEWWQECLEYEMDGIADQITEFWDKSLSWDGPLVVWTSRRVASERAGFLEWVSRAGDRPYKVIDLTNALVAVGRDGGACRPFSAVLPHLLPVQIARSGLLDRAVDMSVTARKEALSRWSRLQAENAPVRRLENGDLVSASIDCWDSLILDQVLTDWRKAALVVGHVLATCWDTGLYQFGDLLISAA